MTVGRGAEGLWHVEDDGLVVAGPFKTSADAWRAVDRMTGDPVSQSEKRADYGWQRFTEQ